MKARLFGVLALLATTTVQADNVPESEVLLVPEDWEPAVTKQD